MDLDRLSSFISAIFEAPRVIPGWDVLADTFAQAFNAEKCSFQICDATTGAPSFIGRTPNFDSNLIANYETRYFKDDLLTRRALSTSLDKPVAGHELIDQETFLASGFYQDFCKPQDLFHTLCGPQNIGDNCLGVINIHRREDGDAFSPDDKRHLSLLLPHIKNAMQINNRAHALSQGQIVTLSAMDQLSLGVIIVGTGGIVRFANKTVERILQSDLGITIRHGHLCLENTATQQALLKAIDDAHKASTGNKGTMIPLWDRSERPISLLVSPFAPVEVKGWPIGPVAAVFINNPDERRGLREDAISKLYALTPAEARLAKGLLDGERLQDYADRVGISLHTVKTQLKQVFSKTGHSRQSDLVRDIMSNPVLRMRSLTPNDNSAVWPIETPRGRSN